MSSMFGPNLYNRGVPTLADIGVPTWYPNLAPDPGVDDTSYTPATVGAAYDQNSTEYRRTESTLGSGGSAAVLFTTAVKRSGTSSLALSVGTTASTTTWVTAFSPTYDVEPGATYVGSVWAATNSASVSRVYVRMAGGSDDSLSEYTALSGTAGALPMTVTCENVNPGGSAINTFQELVIMFTVPAGITRAAFRVYNYLPPTGITVYFDDFKVVKVDDSIYSNTGWVPVPITNTTNFRIYGGGGSESATAPRVRRVGSRVEYRGAAEVIVAGAADAATTTAATQIGLLPPFFRLPADSYSAVYCCQGSSLNRWSLLIAPTGECYAHRYGPSSGIVNAWLPFNVSWFV